jgi:hypothetical protein
MDNKIEKSSPGRPTLYDADILEKVKIYLKITKDKEINKSIRVNLPKIEGLAKFLGVNKDTLYEWAKHYPEFSDALEKVRNEQFCRLIDEGLAGRYNSVITKLILSSNHGLKETTRQINENPQERLKISPDKQNLVNDAIRKLFINKECEICHNSATKE